MGRIETLGGSCVIQRGIVGRYQGIVRADQTRTAFCLEREYGTSDDRDDLVINA
jgi:hypothetical protein